MASALREVFAKFGFEVDSKPLDDADKKTDGFIGKLKELGGLLAGGAVIVGLRNMTLELIHQGDQLANVSQKLGISAQALQGWRFAAEGAGVQQAALDVGLQRFVRRTAEAARGQGVAVKALRELGVSLKDSQGQLRPTTDLLFDVADGLKGIPNQADRVRLAFQLFDSGGVDFVNFLGDGSEAAKEALATFEELGGGLGGDFVEQTKEADDALLEFDVAMLGIRSRIVGSFLPALTRLIEGGSKLLGGFSRLNERTNFLRNTMILAGVAAGAYAAKLLFAFRAPIAAFAKWAFLIGFAILLVDDLVTFFEGGNSITGKWIESLKEFGDIIKDRVTARWEELKNAVLDTILRVKEFFGLADAEDRAASEQRRDRTNLRRAAVGLGTETQQETTDRIEREAARRGEITGRRGESFEQALGRTNALRARENLPPVSRYENGINVPIRPPAPVVPDAITGAGTSINQPTSVVINVPPGTSQQQLRAMEQTIGRVLDRRNAQAAAALNENGVR